MSKEATEISTWKCSPLVKEYLLEQDKYDGEERIRKQKEYEKCLKKTAEIYGTPRKSCALKLL